MTRVETGRPDQATDAPREVPLVSVVTVFYNEEQHLSEAIESVFAQTFDDWELVLVDDGSTDGSAEIARRWAEDHPERVRSVGHPNGENRGISQSRNVGVAESRGTYVAYLDGDDVWLPDKLRRQVGLIAERPGVRIVYGPLRRWYSWTGREADQGRDDLYGIHGEGITLTVDKLYRPGELLALFIEHKDLVPGPSVLFERALFWEVGGAEEEFRARYDDAVVLAKMCLREPTYCSAESWYLYRQDPERTWDPAEQASDRLRFVDWTANYLAAEGVSDPYLLKAIKRARRQIENPRRHAWYSLVRRAERVARRLASWPPRWHEPRRPVPPLPSPDDSNTTVPERS